jgi:hypothetical protein
MLCVYGILLRCAKMYPKFYKEQAEIALPAVHNPQRLLYCTYYLTSE